MSTNIVDLGEFLPAENIPNHLKMDETQPPEITVSGQSYWLKFTAPCEYPVNSGIMETIAFSYLDFGDGNGRVAWAMSCKNDEQSKDKVRALFRECINYKTTHDSRTLPPQVVKKGGHLSHFNKLS